MQLDEPKYNRVYVGVVSCDAIKFPRSVQHYRKVCECLCTMCNKHFFSLFQLKLQTQLETQFVACQM